jgi:catechol 2,3-dioxygenase-like lactoylglutathione lyase family enzyme
MAKGKVEFRPKAVVISCIDHHRSARFYEGVLGASRLPGDGYGCPWFRLGPWDLSLMPNATEGSAGLLPAHAATMLMLEVDDLEAVHRYCLQAGVEVVEPPNGPYMIIADPDGLQIEVWEADEDAEPGSSPDQGRSTAL